MRRNKAANNVLLITIRGSPNEMAESMAHVGYNRTNTNINNIRWEKQEKYLLLGRWSLEKFIMISARFSSSFSFVSRVFSFAFHSIISTFCRRAREHWFELSHNFSVWLNEEKRLNLYYPWRIRLIFSSIRVQTEYFICAYMKYAALISSLSLSLSIYSCYENKCEGADCSSTSYRTSL